jgi:sigma-B regulation protein RsbU (phosphoserine phosphatase)
MERGARRTAMEIGGYTDNRGGLDARRLRMLAELGAQLSAVDDPLQALAAALPAVLDRLGIACDCAVADPASSGEPADLRTVVANQERPVAVIQLRRRHRGQTLAAIPFDAQDRAFVDAVARIAGLAVSQAALRADLAHQDRLAQDLALATELQRSLQPGCDPALMPIWGVNLPARHVSGDFFDFYPMADGRYAFALGDVSGKGMSAALLMVKTISLFRCLSKRIDSPAGLLEAINAELCETAARGMFVTMVAGQYGTRDGRVRFANAGHEPPLFRRKDRTCTDFPATAPPLGILPDNRPPEEEIDLAGGELYVFTDGLTEYRYASGEQLGRDGLIQLVEAYAAEPPARRLTSIIELLDAEVGWEARDDLTVLAIDDSWIRADTAGDASAPQPLSGSVR